MKRLGSVLLAGVFIASLLGLGGCGGGDGGDDPAQANNFENPIIGIGWYYDNIPPDLIESAATCALNFHIVYKNTFNLDEIDSFSVTAPTGVTWTTPAADSYILSGSNHQMFLTLLIDDQDVNMLPLAGVWTASINFRDGRIASFQEVFHDPGHIEDASYQYVYTENFDIFNQPNKELYVSTLKRFPTDGYTVNYFQDNGGYISSAGISAVLSSYIDQELYYYNLNCWLYDANKNYLGYTKLAYEPLNHLNTSLITVDGELFISADLANSNAGGSIDLSQVKYIRVITFDGAQFPPSENYKFDYRAISSLIPVGTNQ